jgi:hypothetical protein
MAHHVGAMPHRNECLWSKVLNMSGFVSDEISLMRPINMRRGYKM